MSTKHLINASVTEWMHGYLLGIWDLPFPALPLGAGSIKVTQNLFSVETHSLIGL